MRSFSKRAFTLIELLIVVAIIAILAAIAVPNFLEAQVRAKVSRAKADMRSLATAIEAYFVDHNEYPYPDSPGGYPEVPPVADGFETHVPSRITTPVSFMSTLPDEPFKEKVFDDENIEYNYNERNYFVITGEETDYNSYISVLLSGLERTIQYDLLSHGPDLDHDEFGSGTEALYDPTNGSTSNGDILYWGPGVGFRN